MSPILIVLIILLIFGVGGYGWHSAGYVGGPFLGGGVGLIVLILVILLLMGRF
jgi:hypothetical protein